MYEQDFNNAIENNSGYWLIQDCYYELTKKQRKIAFNNAIANNQGDFLFKDCYENLTPEQREIASHYINKQ
jgi:hypothetical protein